MENQKNMQRVNFRVNKRIHEFFKNKSEETGVSMSALMFLALEQYVDSKESMEKLPNMMNELQKLAEQVKRNE